jgi:pimeloyl-ACP methyl ester carboxylesterase
LVVSYPPDQPMGYDQLKALVAARLPARPFMLIGESFSGPIAVALAAAGPAMLRGVVLVSSFVRSPIQIPHGLRALLAILPVWRLPVRLAAAVLCGRWSSQAVRSRLSVAMSAVSSVAWRARLRAVLSVDVAEELRLVRAPVLYLRGTSDSVVPRSAWSLIKELLPAARLVELEGPHFLLQTKAVEAAAQVSAFARRIGFAL